MLNQSNVPNQNYLEATNDSRVVPPRMLVDYHNFFATSPVGVPFSFAGGTIERIDTHGASTGELNATFTDATGHQVSLTYWSNLCAKARENMSLAKVWKDTYGFNPN